MGRVDQRAELVIGSGRVVCEPRLGMQKIVYAVAMI